MSDAMELNERLRDEERVRKMVGPKGPTIDGVEFPSPADLRWRESRHQHCVYQLDNLYVYGGAFGSVAQARIEVNNVRLGTQNEAQKYYQAISAAFDARKRADEEREKKNALAYIQGLAPKARF